jgi:hypothetical protein
MRWLEIIGEAFEEKPVTWSPKSNEWNDMKKFLFQVGGHKFHGFFTELGERDGNWELNFVASLGPDQASTDNTGNMGTLAPQVFSHVTSAIKDFINTYKPNTIMFDGDERLGKARLYMAMARHLKSQLASLGYRTAVMGDGSVATFTIEKMPSQ